MNDPAIEHLARVFLVSYRPLNANTFDDIWKGIEVDLERMKSTLDDHEAQCLEDTLRVMIEESIG